MGWIAEIGDGTYNHRFGGSSWKILEKGKPALTPSLLMVLDLTDPRLSSLKAESLEELPLFSHINSNGWHSKQVFQLHTPSRTVEIINQIKITDYFTEEDLFPSPLHETRLELRAMNDSEVLSDEESFGIAYDQFLGDKSFIRILGDILWLEEPETIKCDCQQLMQYCCSIGYENYNHPSGLIFDRAFFIGEGALYFFLCKKCLKLSVISQSS